MSNTFGKQIKVTLFGESHGPKIGAVIDGLTPGIFVDEEKIKECLALRRPSGPHETARVEEDEFEIVSGLFNHYTTGAPLCILVKNNNVHSKDYEINKNLARPSHADYVAHEKYHGFEDYRGGGHFSGRVTVAIVAAGAIILQALDKFKINIATHILNCGSVVDREFKNIDADIEILKNKAFPVLSDVENECLEEINKARLEQDSIGGITQTVINNLPVGIGEPWFDSLEGSLSKAIFGIGGVKGIEFGAGFAFGSMKGSQANDCFYIDDQKVKTKTNNNGGINGGISNGMPVIFSCAIKPTPSISKIQDTIDMMKKENSNIEIIGRHDPAIIRRICIVITCMTALVIADQLAIKYGTDVFLKDKLD
ncbi:MAG: chorismate synthase [Bacilli bacterium]